MSKILVKNATVITMDDSRNDIEENVDILINDNIIEKIEKNIDIADEIKVIDATKKIVCPGFVNTHAHLAMSLFKETSDTYELQDWLQNVAWKAEAKMTPDDIYYLTLLSCIEMIKTGTTTVNDLYFMTDSAIKAGILSKVNMVQCRTLMDCDGEGDTRFDELEDIIRKYKDNENIYIAVGIHGLYTSSEEYVKKAIKLAKENNLFVHMHFCENSQEVEDIKREYNVKTPAEVLKKHFSNVHTVLAHGVKLTDEDINIMKDLDISISHCAISNLKLGCGIARIKDMADNNINITLGTDGQGSGDNMDMFETMKFTALLQKGLKEKANIFTAHDVLKMATKNGANALQMYDRGLLKAGNKADMIIIDLEKDIVTRPVNDIIADIVYNAKGYNVETTICNGKILMQDRKLNTLDEAEIYSKCNEIINRILAK